MEVKTAKHFRKLIEIIKEDGFLSSLDYDYQVTRAINPLINWFMEDVEYLKSPIMSWYGDNERKHISKNYTARYIGGWGKERLESLQLK